MAVKWIFMTFIVLVWLLLPTYEWHMYMCDCHCTWLMANVHVWLSLYTSDCHHKYDWHSACQVVTINMTFTVYARLSVNVWLSQCMQGCQSSYNCHSACHVVTVSIWLSQCMSYCHCQHMTVTVHVRLSSCQGGERAGCCQTGSNPTPGADEGCQTGHPEGKHLRRLDSHSDTARLVYDMSPLAVHKLICQTLLDNQLIVWWISLILYCTFPVLVLVVGPLSCTYVFTRALLILHIMFNTLLLC